ncbi:hypothetical protein Tco_0693201, partial [Tanacetum coccineum]
LEASISVMPFSMFKRLGLRNLRPVIMVIEMAHRGPEDLEELLMKDDINGELGNFLQDNYLLPDYEDPGVIPLSPNRSLGSNWDPFAEIQDSNNNMGIGIDDFVAIDDLWDDLDPGALTNEQPLKLEFLNVGKRVHRHNPYNLQITCKIRFSQQGNGIQGQFNSFSCGKKGIRESRDDLLPLSFEEQSNAQGSFLF